MAFSMLAFAGCKQKTAETEPVSELQQKVDEYAEFTLSSDLVAGLSDSEKQLIPIFVRIAEIMDDLFWEQSFGTDNRRALDTLSDPAMKAFAQLQYGAWDRLDSERPFVTGFGEKPKGANFYPTDMTDEEFKALDNPLKDSQYSIIRRDASGQLIVLPYHEAYKEQLAEVDSLLGVAINLAEDKGMKTYLTERRKALQTDDYYASDLAWLGMKESKMDFVFGPIEDYEDALYGRKTAYEAFILLKDVQWSQDLAKYVKMLPQLQSDLPCDAKYKTEVPGTDCDLNVYDVVYYAGDCNAASKTIAINLPNDERIHKATGSRRLQLKNAMRAKFDKIMVPISNIMICEEQQQNVKFDAFFSNVCFHEVAHGLGIKNTVTGKGTVREALGNMYSQWEEAKADICGLFITQRLIEMGEMEGITVEDAYVTYVAGLFRSVRFGATEAHGIANMMCFNFMQDKGAFTRDANGRYHVDMTKAQSALNEWAALIMQTEGEGDYDFAKKYAAEHGTVGTTLQQDLDNIRNANIPKDIRYNQGLQALGLK